LLVSDNKKARLRKVTDHAGYKRSRKSGEVKGWIRRMIAGRAAKAKARGGEPRAFSGLARHLAGIDLKLLSAKPRAHNGDDNATPLTLAETSANVRIHGD